MNGQPVRTTSTLKVVITFGAILVFAVAGDRLSELPHPVPYIFVLGALVLSVMAYAWRSDLKFWSSEACQRQEWIVAESFSLHDQNFGQAVTGWFEETVHSGEEVCRMSLEPVLDELNQSDEPTQVVVTLELRGTKKIQPRRQLMIFRAQTLTNALDLVDLWCNANRERFEVLQRARPTEGNLAVIIQLVKTR